MIRFGSGILGVLAVLVTLAIIYCIHFGLIMLLWNLIMVGLFDLPMINFGQAIGLWLLGQFITNGIPVKPMFIRPKRIIYKEDENVE